MTEHKDTIGQVLAIGDTVVYAHKDYQWLQLTKVTGFILQKVRLTGKTLRDPESLLKVKGPVIEAYMASRRMV